MKRNVYFLSVLIFLFSCNLHINKYPVNVQETLKKSGKNHQELENVINQYQNPKDSLKLKAAYFLIGNMDNHCYVSFKMVDSTGKKVPWNIFDYANYNKLVQGWDSIEKIRGPIHFTVDKKIMDYDTITADYLINNIDLAFKAWTKNPWSRHLNFEQFCEYILPYRGSNEPLENWRSYFSKNLSWVKDSLKNDDDPIKAGYLINDNLKSWFKFDPRYYEHPTDQGLSEMLKNKTGRCEDMTNIAIYAFRAMGVPVMSDYTPYWAKTGNNHAWNASLDKNGNIVIFMGCEANPGKYKLSHELAKVYRKTFAEQSDCLDKVKQKWEQAPPYLKSNTYTDVTKDYVPVTDVKLTLEKIPDSTSIAYICVFNTGEWRAIQWSKIIDKKVDFTDMGMNIAYLPAFYINKKIIPAGKQFILNRKAKVKTITADTVNAITIKLLSTTKRKTMQSTDFIQKASFKEGVNYTLYYWNNKWVEIGKQKAKKGPLIFKNVPSNALYWLVSANSHKDKEERIFTIDKKGKQIWW